MTHARAVVPLSARQAEIADRVIAGESNREIADALSLSARTVETHVAAIFDKYGVSSRVALTAARLGERTRDGEPGVASRGRTNLAHARADLIGRDAEIAELVATLRDRRLVSVIGTGGVGKTSVAREVGRAMLGESDVWFVELAPVADPAAIGDAVARAINVTVGRTADALDTVCAHVERRQTLVVFDNCEHLTEAVAQAVDALLDACPLLCVLTTSREPLRTAAEITYRLSPLRVPTPQESLALRAESGTSFAAIALFAERARAADRTFVLGDDNVTIVAEICRRLDGVPLAIELAAARVTILSIRALATKLDRQLDLLRGGDRTVLARHQTMRALIDWSHALLSPAERRLFACLSVFADGCALTEATAVYSDAGEDELVVLDMLSSLASKSLLVVDRTRPETRFGLLESFREFAAERLDSYDDAPLVARRHAVAFANLAERLDDQYEFGPSGAALERVRDEDRNFQRALEWALGRRNDVTTGQRIVAATRGLVTNRLQRFPYVPIARALVDARTPHVLAARLEFSVAVAAYVEQQLPEAVASACRAIASFAALDEPLGLAKARATAGHALALLGRHAEGEPFVERALAEGPPRPAMWRALALQGAARIAFSRGDVARGRDRLRDARSIFAANGANRYAAAMDVVLGECEFEAGNVELAYEIVVAALPTFVAAGDLITLTAARINLAGYDVARERWDAARDRALAALESARSVRYKLGETCALQRLAAIACFARPAAARDRAIFADAARVIGFVDAVLARDGTTHEGNEQREHDRLRSLLEATLPPVDFASYLAEGADMTLDRACERASSLPIHHATDTNDSATPSVTLARD